MRTFSRALLCVSLSIVPILTSAQRLRAQDEQPVVEEGSIDTPYRWIERGFRVGLYGGYTFASRGMLSMGPGPTPIVGVRARVRVSSPLSLEFNFGYGFDSNLYLLDPRSEQYPSPVDTVGVTWALLEAALQFSLTGARTWHGLQPYFILGGGIFFGLSQQPTNQIPIPRAPFLFTIGTQPVFQFGIGIERQLGRVGLAFEVRDQLWRISAPEGFFQPVVLADLAERGSPVAQSSDWLNNFELSLAFYYYF